MCMCIRLGAQKGIPLNDETFSKMRGEERSFWKDFLKQADEVIDKKEKKGDTQPFTPPMSLKKKYQKAITKYDGQKYCQINQLQEIFSF